MSDSVVPPTSTAKPLVIGIAGCSGSGKTTLARELARELSATLLPLDLYYRDLTHLTPLQRAVQNFDHPDSLEHNLLIEHVKELASGRAVQAPSYDFATHSRRRDETFAVAATDVVLVEGILALHYDDLRPLFGFSIFVNAPIAVCLKRRVYRDIAERGRTEDCVTRQFWATAQPMAEEYVLPSASHATLVVDGCESLDWSVEQVLALLRRKGHLPRNRVHAGQPLV